MSRGLYGTKRQNYIPVFIGQASEAVCIYLTIWSRPYIMYGLLISRHIELQCVDWCTFTEQTLSVRRKSEPHKTILDALYRYYAIWALNKLVLPYVVRMVNFGAKATHSSTLKPGITKVHRQASSSTRWRILLLWMLCKTGLQCHVDINHIPAYVATWNI